MSNPLTISETDFNFLLAATEQLASKSLPTYDTLPVRTKLELIKILVDMNRLSQPVKNELPSSVAHYAGKDLVNNSANFLKFNIRSKFKSPPRRDGVRHVFSAKRGRHENNHSRLIENSPEGPLKLPRPGTIASSVAADRPLR